MRAHRRSHISDGVRTALRQQLLLDHHSAGWQPERHLCRQQLPDPGRTLPARSADHGVLPTRVPGAGNAVAAFRRKMTQECAKRYETAREIISMGVIASQCEYAKLKRAFESNGRQLERSADNHVSREDIHDIQMEQ